MGQTSLQATTLLLLLLALAKGPN